MYDVVVAGGSIAGLCCAREAALGGCSVLVIEDDAEVGTPDHCGGMVSVSALQRLQVTPRIKMSSHKVHTAKIFSPSGYSVSFDAKAQNVISIDRRELDKEIARQAQKAGAIVRIKTKYVERTQDGIRTGSEEIACREFVDAKGYLGQPKIVLKVPGPVELDQIKKDAITLAVPWCVIEDAGRTQIAPGTVTCLALGPAPEEHIDTDYRGSETSLVMALICMTSLNLWTPDVSPSNKMMQKSSSGMDAHKLRR